MKLIEKRDFEWIIRLSISVGLIMELGVQTYKQNYMNVVILSLFSMLLIYTTLSYYHGIKTEQERETKSEFL